MNLPDGWVISSRPAHPALVSEDDFVAAQDINAARGPVPHAAPVLRRDQRGCGRSLRGPQDPAGISLEAMVADTISLLGVLRDRFGGKTYVAGFSFGATLAAFAAAQRPDLVGTLVATGMDIDGAAAATALTSSRCARQAARQPARDPATGGHRPASAPDLQAVRHPGPLGFQLRRSHDRRNVRLPGPRTGIQPGALSDYSARDIIRTVRGITATQAALLPDLASMDLTRSVPRLDVPVVMVQGRLDQVAPGESAQQYASSLQSPGKQLIWFETSAHTPHLDDPAKFRDVLLGIRDSQLAAHDMTRSCAALAAPAERGTKNTG